MNISDLDYYVLFVIKDVTNDRIFSTTDIKALKSCTGAKDFEIGKNVEFNNEPYIVKDVSLSKVGDTLNNDHDYGWSAEGVNPEGDRKDVLFRVTILLEEPLT